MKGISLWQPWASAIAHGSKHFETRSWLVPQKLIGETVAIHAAKRRLTIDEQWELFHYIQPFKPNELWGRPYVELPFGAVVCVAELAWCHCVETVLGRSGGFPRMEKVLGNYEPGRYAWELKNVQRLVTPIECKGAQSFFDLPADVTIAIRKQIGRTV